MCPLKSYLAAVAATCCVQSAVAQPAEPRPSGLDPNKRFNSVEIIAGRETVDYVRNILKSRVAYHLALDPNEVVQSPATSEKQT